MVMSNLVVMDNDKNEVEQKVLVGVDGDRKKIVDINLIETWNEKKGKKRE